MKKITLILFVCLIGLSIKYVKGQSPLNFGLKGGVLYNEVTLDNDAFDFDSEYVTTYLGGVFLRINFQRFFLQPELYYTSQGSDFSVVGNNTTADVEGQIRLRTIDLPALVGFKLLGADSDFFNLRVNGGPIFSFVLNDDNDFGILDNNDELDFNTSNVGYQIGLGVDLGNITLDARYEGDLGGIGDNFNRRVNMFQFAFGFKFL